MDVERELERFVEGVADPALARDEHRRELRRQVLAAMSSAPEGNVVRSSLTSRLPSIS